MTTFNRLFIFLLILSFPSILYSRYYDPKLGRWIRPDPILDKYLPVGDKKHDQNLPGMGGIYNSTNINMYTYSGNNPVTFFDPDGNEYILPQGSGLSAKQRTIPTKLDDIVSKVRNDNAFRSYFTNIAACAQTAAAIQAAQMGERDMSKAYKWNSLHTMAIDIINDSKATTAISLAEAKPGDIVAFRRKEGETGATGHIATITKIHSIFGKAIGVTVLEGHMSGEKDRLNERFIPSVMFSTDSVLSWGHGLTSNSSLEFDSIRRWTGKPTK